MFCWLSQKDQAVSVLPGRESLSLVRWARRFIIFETVLGIVGITFFEWPAVLTFILFLNVWAILGELLDSGAFRSLRSRAWADHRLSVRASPVLVPIAVAVIGWLVMRGPVEDALWDTGRFGEPPNNRLVCVYEKQGLLELRVRVTTVEAPLFAFLRFENRVDRELIKYWFGVPGLRGKEKRYPTMSSVSGDGLAYRMETTTQSITKTQSLYFKYEGEGNATIQLAFFGPISDKSVSHKSLPLIVCQPNEHK